MQSITQFSFSRRDALGMCASAVLCGNATNAAVIDSKDGKLQVDGFVDDTMARFEVDSKSQLTSSIGPVTTGLVEDRQIFPNGARLVQQFNEGSWNLSIISRSGSCQPIQTKGDVIDAKISNDGLRFAFVESDENSTRLMTCTKQFPYPQPIFSSTNSFIRGIQWSHDDAVIAAVGFDWNEEKTIPKPASYRVEIFPLYGRTKRRQVLNNSTWLDNISWS